MTSPSQKPPRFQGVLFDHDGVIVSSEPLHRAAWQRLFADLDIPYREQDFLDRIGLPAPIILKDLVGQKLGELSRDQIDQLCLKKNDYYLEIAAQGLALNPGISDLLEYLKSEKIPCAVVSNAKKRELEFAYDRLGIRGYFQGIYSRDDVPAPKPDPRAYAFGASSLGLLPEDCLVIEDTPTGIQSALLGGISAIGLLGSFPLEYLENPVPGRPDLKPIWIARTPQGILTWLKAFRIAEKSLKSNIRQVRRSSGSQKTRPLEDMRSYLTAGSHQFKSAWTRDFCFASHGLPALDLESVACSHLDGLIENQRKEDGLLPRYLGSASHLVRTLGYIFGTPIPFKFPLMPEFEGGAGGEGRAIDSNALALIASARLNQRSPDWWSKHQTQLQLALNYYDTIWDEKLQLVRQTPFGDWQDSVSREGFTFYVNLVYWKALSDCQALGLKIPAGRVESLKQSLIKKFFDPGTGLFQSWLNHSQISIDGNLLAIAYGFFDPRSSEARALYEALKRHPLWTRHRIPGCATIPDYDQSEKSSQVGLVGLNDYHDQIIWSWLVGLSIQISGLMGDLAERDRILDEYTKILERDGSVEEVLEPNDPSHPPVHRLVGVRWAARLGYKVYRSEHPFSWGAGVLLWGLSRE